MNFISGKPATVLAVAAGAMLATVAFIGAVKAADDLPIVGDISMPEVHVDVRVGDEQRYAPSPTHRPAFVDPRGRFAAIPQDGPAVSQLDVARMLRATGYSLLGGINRRGWVYTVSVINPRGDDGRAIVDARTGAIIRFIPAYAVNSRLNDELGVIYGPPGPPPLAQDVGRTPAPPRGAKRHAAPKLAAGAPTNVPASPISKPQDARAEMKPSPQQEAKPATELKLWPTQAIPDVQPLE